MKRMIIIWLCVFTWTGFVSAESQPSEVKHRIMVVSSYHPEYVWSQDTNAGLCAMFLERGLLDDDKQAQAFTQNFAVESSQAVLQKMWMNTKLQSSRAEIGAATARVIKAIDEFKPDLILLGDDNAVNYIGNHYMDTEIPVVFWGVNGDPGKYGLIETMERPDHNVTGIYQAGYWLENLRTLQQLVPSIKSIAILSDDSPTSRSKVKEIQRLEDMGYLEIKIVSIIVTNSFVEWKNRALDVQGQVGAYFMLNNNTLKDENDQPVPTQTVAAWYLQNISRPECAGEKWLVEAGMLITVDDSGYKQGYAAGDYAYRILAEGVEPGVLPVVAPTRGSVIVNRERARMLNLDLADKPFIEEYIDEAVALKQLTTN